ncbi:Acg family FMN-binding oxidoreductase [Streptomyces sp. AN091965]|uniref:Acg family FMN-binding oxidoreductase n=1 Tax=Streptomyces sp. AN091965 TaxID=2927803 RepID=UPI001F625096|nr:nitroreductase family protein [Streptomyces sp. AN091965]MCI3928873.1 nitroreductase family protein [Streptomyces sp. AN091965]
MTAERNPSPHVRAAHHLVRAAILAPSLHNSQPWLFACSDNALLLYADHRRRLPFCDPYGRQLVISGGAALFNLRLAMRHLGFRPVVRPFPDPATPGLLARVEWGAFARVTHDVEAMHQALRHRHTHRGPFASADVPPSLIEALTRHTQVEGVQLYALEDTATRRRLSRLVHEAEARERHNPGFRAELLDWARPYGDARGDGVPAAARAFHPDCVALAGRDFTGLTRQRDTARPRETWPARTGLVIVLSTPHDTRQDWLRAGQALQRVLLYTAGHGFAAGFHTQPLEFADLRALVRTLAPTGQHPQLVLRLGRINWQVRAPRRALSEVLPRNDLAPAGTGHAA